MIVAVDWDDTLVDAKTQEWLPGAQAALESLLAQFKTVIIHTCRANWPEGLSSIEAKLAPFRHDIRIVGKPLADVYVDDRAVRFTGWPATLAELPATIDRGAPVVRLPRRSDAVDPSAAAILSGWRA